MATVGDGVAGVSPVRDLCLAGQAAPSRPTTWAVAQRWSCVVLQPPDSKEG